MPLSEQFIPGRWIDTIDVNDFINLNRKPFSGDPFFLTEPASGMTVKRYQAILSLLEKQAADVELAFPSLEDESAKWVFDDFSDRPLTRKIGFSENPQDMQAFYRIRSREARTSSRKTAPQLFDEVVTSEIGKMLKMNLFRRVPTTYSPFHIHPDVRIIPLYGTKQLTKEKRWSLKTLEKHLQTHDWMQRRISIHRELEAIKQFERFAANHHVDVTRPAQNAQEAVLFSLLALAGAMLENPSIPFSLHQLLPFLDIYIEHDLETGKLDEEGAQELMDQFYLKLAFIRFSLGPGLARQHESTPFFFGETFGSEGITKTSYRFLYALRRFDLFPFAIRILWSEGIPSPFQSFIRELIQADIPLSLYAENGYTHRDGLSFFPNGLNGVPSEDALYDAGGCDLEKLLYLSLNGGRDVAHNINLSPITQPVRGGLEFDEIINKFRDYLSYTLSSYVELMNIVLYLNAIQNSHPFRSSLMGHMLYHHVQFGFFNVEKTARILSAVYEGTCQATRDSKGWITDTILPDESPTYSGMLAQLSEMIHGEIRKIPIYMNGKPHVKFYLRELDDHMNETAVPARQILPYELSNIIFRVNVLLETPEQALAHIRQYFGMGYREIHLFTSEKRKNINGILYDQRDR